MARRRRKEKAPVEQSVSALVWLFAFPFALIACLFKDD
jgi:hypothetical protein